MYNVHTPIAFFFRYHTGCGKVLSALTNFVFVSSLNEYAFDNIKPEITHIEVRLLAIHGPIETSVASTTASTYLSLAMTARFE